MKINTRLQIPLEPIPPGYCKCGCGQKTKIAERNYLARGLKKGELYPFVRGHNYRFRGGPAVPIGMKWCPDCNQIKSLDEFFKHTNSPNGVQGVCKICSYERHKRYAAKNSERIHRLDHKRLLKFKYGMTLEQYDALFEKQSGKCAICGRTEMSNRTTAQRYLSVDHNHATEKIRGLLCDRCNRAVGLIGEDYTILEKAIEYLKH